MSFKDRVLVWILGAAAFLAALLYSFPGKAHGDAAWIQANPDYRAESGVHCCGPNDCRRIIEGVDFVEVQGGFLFLNNGQFFPVTRRGYYTSAEPDTDIQVWWGCFFAGQWQCVFQPWSGT
jgi:hypothetical protein